MCACIGISSAISYCECTNSAVVVHFQEAEEAAWRKDQDAKLKQLQDWQKQAEKSSKQLAEEDAKRREQQNANAVAEEMTAAREEATAEQWKNEQNEKWKVWLTSIYFEVLGSDAYKYLSIKLPLMLYVSL